MTNSYKTLLFGLVLFVLFSSLIIAVAVDFGAEYDHSADEIGGGSLNLTLFEESSESVNSSAQGYRSRFESGDVDDVDDPSGLFSVITDMVSMVTTPFNLLSKVLVNLLHLPSLFINVVLGLLSISVFLAIWKIMRAGA